MAISVPILATLDACKFLVTPVKPVMIEPTMEKLGGLPPNFVQPTYKYKPELSDG